MLSTALLPMLFQLLLYLTKAIYSIHVQSGQSDRMAVVTVVVAYHHGLPS